MKPQAISKEKFYNLLNKAIRTDAKEVLQKRKQKKSGLEKGRFLIQNNRYAQ